MRNRIYIVILALVAASVALGTDILKISVGGAVGLSVGNVVKITGTDAVSLCGDGDIPAGVIIGFEDFGGSRYYLIASSGLVENVLLAGTVGVGDIGKRLIPASSGRVKLADTPPTGYVVGLALQPGVAGDYIKMMVNIDVGGGLGAGELNQSITTGAGITGAESGSTGAVTLDLDLSANSGLLFSGSGDSRTIGLNFGTGTYQAARGDHSHGDIYDNYVYWRLRANYEATPANITAGSTVQFLGSGGISISRSSNTITISASGTGEANQTITTGAGLTGAELGTTGDLTIDVGAGWGISTTATAVSVNQATLDGRYLQTEADGVIGNEVVTGLSFAGGNLNLTQNAGTSPITVSLDGRYLTSEVDGTIGNEVVTGLSFAGGNLNLTQNAGTSPISVSLDGRYLTSEADPEVGSNTLNYVPKWNGSALVTGSIYDNTNIGIGTTAVSSAKLTVSYGSTDIYGIYVTTPGWAIYGDANGGGGRGVMGRGGEMGIRGENLFSSSTWGALGYYDGSNYYGGYFNANTGLANTYGYYLNGTGSNNAGIYTQAASNRLFVRAESTSPVALFHSTGLTIRPTASDGYINFGNSSAGSGGYGFRDSGGTMQYKNFGGSWANFGSVSSHNHWGENWTGTGSYGLRFGNTSNPTNQVDIASNVNGISITHYNYASTGAALDAMEGDGGANTYSYAKLAWYTDASVGPTNVGVFGRIHASSGAGGAAIYGENKRYGISNQWAGYFDGDVHVTEDIEVDGGITLGGVTQYSWPSAGTNYWSDAGNYLYPIGGIGTNLQVADVQSHTYGFYANMTGTYGGYFVGSSYGGYFSGSSYGAYGYSSSGHGLYGYTTAASAGTHGVYGYNGSGNNATSSTRDGSQNGVLGFTINGYPHHYGVMGARWDDGYGPSGGVIGLVNFNNASQPWGALGFQDASLNEYAGYFNGNVYVTGGITLGGVTQYSWPSGGSSLWADEGTYVYPTTSVNFQVYDNTSDYIGLLFVPSISTEAVTNWINSSVNVMHCYNSAGTYYGLYTSGGNYGVYASGSTYAGYFSGNVHITGNLTVGGSYPGGGGGSNWTRSGTQLSPLNSGDNVYVSVSSATQAVYGYNSNTSSGTHGLYGYQSTSANATNYDVYSSINGVAGYLFYGNDYHFGVNGRSWGSDSGTRTGGVLGTMIGSTAWGSLSYKNSGSSFYGAYWTGSGSGSGRRRPTTAVSDGLAHYSIGAGGYGDLFGIHVEGNIYGAYFRGGRYALYTKGDRYSNGLDVHLTDIGGEEMAVSFTNTSTEATITADGTARLSGGVCVVRFDEGFRSLADGDRPITITATPLGPSNGIYISESDANGFKVIENGEGRSDVSFSWIAVARRIDAKTKEQLPREVVAVDYNDKITRGLHNDADTQTSGEGLYYQDGELVVGVHPSLLPNPAVIELKQAFEQNPLAHSFSEWQSMFRAHGSEIGISETEFNYMSQSGSSNPVLFDQFGNQIPSEWIEELQAEGVQMFTREEAEARRKQALIDNARATREADSAADNIRKETEKNSEQRKSNLASSNGTKTIDNNTNIK